VRAESEEGPFDVKRVVLAPIVVYQRYISPAFPRRCKYYPTCSAYAVEAIREVGVVRGLILAAWRLVRCNPFSNGGYDPVENRPFFRSPDDEPTSNHRGAAA
jgi:uncharacterized protein